MKTNGGYLSRFLVWRLKHISNKNFVLILSALIGCCAGLASVSLKWCTHEMYLLVTDDFRTGSVNYYYMALPFAGLVITVVLGKYFFKEKFGHGVSTVLWYISKGSSIMKFRKVISRWVTSIFTVGFGGSVGLESPIVVIGSAIGSNFGRYGHLNYKKRTLLIGCGAAGAISAIFNAPIAGVIFAMEVILAESAITSFIPLIIASVSGKLMTMIFVGASPVFSWKNVDVFSAADVPYYLVLGVFCGLMALYFTLTQYFIEQRLDKVRNEMVRVVLGGVILGLIIFIFPPIFGEGYDVIRTLMTTGEANALMSDSIFMNRVGEDFLIGFVAIMVLFKAVATAITIGSGGNGGIFAPTLFVGGVSGALFATGVNYLGLGNVSLRNFTLVGMCGLMSGIQHAPMSAIFLIAEMTGGYDLFIPLMIVSAISYMTKSYFEPHSLYTKRLIEKGDLITNNKDKQVLSLLKLNELLEKDFKTIHVDASLGEMVEAVKESTRNIFPVVDQDGVLVGILRLDDVRRIMFDQHVYNEIMIKTLMQKPRDKILNTDDMAIVMGKFESSRLWNMAVVDKDGVYLGMISKSKIFNSYRKRLIAQHKE